MNVLARFLAYRYTKDQLIAIRRTSAIVFLLLLVVLITLALNWDLK